MTHRNTQGVRVLLVDDSPALLDVLEALLERADDRLTVETATSGEAALEVLADEPVDCIVTGYELSDMSGRELFDAASDADPDVGFVLMSNPEPTRLPGQVAAEVDACYRKMEAVNRSTELADRIRSLVYRPAPDPDCRTVTTES